MHDEHLKHWLDVASIGGVIGAFIGALPSIAAFFSLLWTIGRLIEMFTGKQFHIVWHEWFGK